MASCLLTHLPTQPQKERRKEKRTVVKTTQTCKERKRLKLVALVCKLPGRANDPRQCHHHPYGQHTLVGPWGYNSHFYSKATNYQWVGAPACSKPGSSKVTTDEREASNGQSKVNTQEQHQNNRKTQPGKEGKTKQTPPYPAHP